MHQAACCRPAAIRYTHRGTEKHGTTGHAPPGILGRVASVKLGGVQGQREERGQRVSLLIRKLHGWVAGGRSGHEAQAGEVLRILAAAAPLQPPPLKCRCWQPPRAGWRQSDGCLSPVAAAGQQNNAGGGSRARWDFAHLQPGCKPCCRFAAVAALTADRDARAAASCKCAAAPESGHSLPRSTCSRLFVPKREEEQGTGRTFQGHVRAALAEPSSAPPPAADSAVRNGPLRPRGTS